MNHSLLKIIGRRTSAMSKYNYDIFADKPVICKEIENVVLIKQGCTSIHKIWNNRVCRYLSEVFFTVLHNLFYTYNKIMLPGIGTFHKQWHEPTETSDGYYDIIFKSSVTLIKEINNAKH